MARHGSAVLVLGVAVAIGAANVTAQQPAPAGAKRPNLRVLQALPESQLFPLMNLVSESLGVRCDYCHVQAAPDLTRTPSNVGGWVWDSDEKPQKRKAREMMQMVVELNATRFAGESRVTCFTCHRGSTEPLRLPPLPPRAEMPTTPAPAPLPSADQVWASYVNAVGRDEGAARLTGTVLSGWDERIEGRYGKVEITLGGGDRYRATLATPEGQVTQGLDGDVAWVSSPAGVQRLAASDVARVRCVAMRYRPVKVERPANLRVVGVERLADGDAYVATAEIDPVTTRALYFDVVTGLLRRDLTTTETLLLPLMEQVDYDDYRNLGGVKLPFRMRVSDGARYYALTRTFNEIRRGVAVDDAAFRLPPTAPQ